MHIVQVIDGDNRTVYPSVAAASRATGIHRATIRKHMADGAFSLNSLGRCKSVTVFNSRRDISMTYPSMAEAARVLDVDVSQISRAVRNGNWVFSLALPVKVRLAI